MNTMIQEAAFYRELGERLKASRKARDLTQEELAKKVDLTRTSITNIEKGRQKVLAHVLVQLADALHEPLSNLLPKRDRAAEALSKVPESHRHVIEKAITSKRNQ